MVLEIKDELVAPGAHAKWLWVHTRLGGAGLRLQLVVLHGGHICVWKLSGSPTLVFPIAEDTWKHINLDRKWAADRCWAEDCAFYF